ncbi:MAG: DUF481 domain-containing protein [Ignavibacteriaceae bacterium]
MLNLNFINRPFFLLTAILFLLLTNQVLAQRTDVVIMNNGDHITGEVKRLELGILVFKTDDAGTINIKWDKIKNVKTDNIYEVELQDGRVYYGSIEPTADDGMLLIKGVTLETKLFMKYMAKITRIKESFWDILDGYVRLGISFTKASQIGQLSFGLNGNYRTKIFYADLNANSVITTTNEQTTSRKQDIYITYRRFMETKLFYAGFVGAEENTELGIQLRASLGGGFGSTFIQDDHNWLLGIAGLTVNREWYIDSTEATYNIEALFSGQYQIFIYDAPKVSLNTSLNFLPSVTNFGRIRSNLDIDLDWEIFIDFYWVLSFYFTYDNKPTTTASEIDYRIETSVKYEL